MSILEIIREFVTRVVELLKNQKRWRRPSVKKAKEDQRHAKPNTVVVVERQMRMREFAAPVHRVQSVPQPNRAVVRLQSTDPPKYPGEEVQQQQRIIRRRIMVVSNPDPMESDSETETAPKRREGKNDDDHLLYLLSPAGRKTAHKHTDEHLHEHELESVSAAAAHADEPPMTDDEGTEVSGEEIKESIAQAITEDSPKHAQAHEEEMTASASGSSSQSESTSEGDADAGPEQDSDTTQESNPGPAETETASTAEAEDSQKEMPADAESETEKPSVGF
ncbi:hypothetical protein EDD15DRAFT_2370987 [Pisolithus albus]|nr:hypothetical protein EDD15DRAFT_2370987 [Pisolithus albus]